MTERDSRALVITMNIQTPDDELAPTFLTLNWRGTPIEGRVEACEHRGNGVSWVQVVFTDLPDHVVAELDAVQ